VKIFVTITMFLVSAACITHLNGQTALYPGTVVTDEQLKVMVNGMQTTLNGNLSSTANSIAVAACGTIPANSLGTADQEIFAILSCSGGVITVDTSAQGCTMGRGCDNTVPAGHVTGALVSLYFDSWHHNSLRVEVEAIEAALGVNLANVVTGGTFNGNLTIGSAGSLTVNGVLSGSHAQPLGAGDSPTFVNTTFTGTLAVTGVTTLTGALKANGGTTTTTLVWGNGGAQIGQLSFGSGFISLGPTSSNTGVTISSSGSGKLTLAGNPIMTLVPTSAGSGGLYLCIDSSGNVYQKSSCP
jgi:hypothetical protein